MARKEWELLFNLSAKQNSNFSSTFKAAQSALAETQNRIQQLNKVQSDITAYQKQQQAVDFAAIQQAAGLSENSMQTFYHDWTVYNEYEALTANTAAPAEVVSASNSTPSEGSPISINFAPVYNFSGVSDTQQFESLLTSHDDDMREYILGVVEEAEHDKFRRAYA